jgi:hypothetical protein
MDFRTLDDPFATDPYERIDEHVSYLLRGGRSAVIGSDGVLPVISTPQDLADFIWKYFGIRIANRKNKGHGTFGPCRHCNATPWEAFCYAYFGVGPTCIWTASRGFGGKSFMLALLALCEALTLRADVNVLGGSGVQSKRVLAAMSKQWAHPGSPRWTLTSEPSKETTSFKWGNEVTALMASQKSVRGPHPQRLRLDEIDEMNLAILQASQGQTMSRNGVLSQTVMSSTHQYPNGTFTAQLQEAAEKGWPVFRWCYRENLVENGGFIEPDEIRRKKTEITRQMWDTEYEMQEPTSEDRAFDTESLQQIFIPELPTLVGPEPGGYYVHGADWARKVHFSVVTTLRQNVTPMRGVKIERERRRPWPVMVALLDDRVREYGGEAVHDGTGVGDVVAGYLQYGAEPFIMVGKPRADLFTEYIHGCEHKEILYPRPGEGPWEVFFRAHLYATTDQIYHDEHPPDDVVSGALAYRAAKKPRPSGATRDPDPQVAPHLQNLGERKPGHGGIFGNRPDPFRRRERR